MPDAEQCRRYARQFLMRSRQENDPEAKAALIEIALYWTRLAAQAADTSRDIQEEQHAQNTTSPSLAPE
jgi:hypothetical protein